jgi:hypothetical protein
VVAGEGALRDLQAGVSALRKQIETLTSSMARDEAGQDGEPAG